MALDLPNFAMFRFSLVKPVEPKAKGRVACQLRDLIYDSVKQDQSLSNFPTSHVCHPGPNSVECLPLAPGRGAVLDSWLTLPSRKASGLA